MVSRDDIGPIASGASHPALYLSPVVHLTIEPITISGLVEEGPHTDSLISLRMWGKVIRMTG